MKLAWPGQIIGYIGARLKFALVIKGLLNYKLMKLAWPEQIIGYIGA